MCTAEARSWLALAAVSSSDCFITSSNRAAAKSAACKANSLWLGPVPSSSSPPASSSRPKCSLARVVSVRAFGQAGEPASSQKARTSFVTSTASFKAPAERRAHAADCKHSTWLVKSPMSSARLAAMRKASTASSKEPICKCQLPAENRASASTLASVAAGSAPSRPPVGACAACAKSAAVGSCECPTSTSLPPRYTGLQ
mmetsp:Transcript_70044/g.226635  ORF Transcript_70044/g.226635 Transcript_70044/m.226635 type:complete len:200 (-) Transcript_70044:430-1029(-)